MRCPLPWSSTEVVSGHRTTYYATSRVKQSGLVISGLLNLKDTTKYGYCMFKVTSSIKKQTNMCQSYILYIVPIMIFSIRMTMLLFFPVNSSSSTLQHMVLTS